MSKNVVIQRNGVSETWEGIEVIRTQAYGGGTVEWVPEDERTGIAFQATENGTYLASDYGVYAFTSVTVLVEGGSVRGYIDGVLYDITVDSNGNLVYTPVQE